MPVGGGTGGGNEVAEEDGNGTTTTFMFEEAGGTRDEGKRIGGVADCATVLRFVEALLVSEDEPASDVTAAEEAASLRLLS